MRGNRRALLVNKKPVINVPIVDFTADNLAPATGIAVNFTITNTGGAAASATFDPGDGSGPTALSAPFTSKAYTYTVGGTYTVVVTMTNANPATPITRTRTNYIVVTSA